MLGAVLGFAASPLGKIGGAVGVIALLLGWHALDKRSAVNEATAQLKADIALASQLLKKTVSDMAQENQAALIEAQKRSNELAADLTARHKAREAFLERKAEFTAQQLDKQKKARDALVERVEAAKLVAGELEKEIAENRVTAKNNSCFIVTDDFLGGLLKIKQRIRASNH